MERDRDAPPNRDDFDAAARAIARNWPNVQEGGTKYDEFLKALAKFHQLVGTETFELRYNLRPPEGRVEEWEYQLMHGVITEQEYEAKLRADAERPIDQAMLATFCQAYHDNLVVYGRILQNAAAVASPRDTVADLRRREREIDKDIDSLRSKLPLWRQNLETVFHFLEELRIVSGRGLVTVKSFEGTSAHWLAQLAFKRAIDAWASCKEVAHRSQTDPAYLYATTASSLFMQTWVPDLPLPQQLSERLREEQILARKALEQDAAAPSNATSLKNNESHTAAAAAPDLDNESKELSLVGRVLTICAEAGQIFRPTPNSDWGIDGEIEFKDDAGLATGKRVYLQLKAGDSHLTTRKGDGASVFANKNRRHEEYWQQQAYDVWLVIGRSDGTIEWMNVTSYLKAERQRTGTPTTQVIFSGLTFDAVSIRAFRDQLIRPLA